MERLGPDQLIRVHRSLLDAQLDLLRGAEGLTGSAVAQYDAEVDKWYQRRKAAGDVADYLKELYTEQKTDALDGYPQLLRAALFAIAYGELEHFLNRICREDSRQRGGPDLNDLRGEGIQRTKVYLTKVAKLNFPTTPEWQDLTNYGHLRNALVHAQGDVTLFSRLPGIQQLEKRAGTFQVATRAERKLVVLGQGFLGGFVLTVETFGEQLEEATNPIR